MNKILRNISKDNQGFTLIEIIIVVVVISISAMIVIPRIGGFFSSDRENFAVLTGTIVKTFDDAFINGRVNYLAVHLFETGDQTLEENENNIFARENSLSVLNFANGTFTDNPKKILRPRAFPDSFRFEEVILKDGKTFTDGTVMIPFYPQGYSDNAIIHIMINEEDKWSVKIMKHMKEPRVIPDYVNYEE